MRCKACNKVTSNKRKGGDFYCDVCYQVSKRNLNELTNGGFTLGDAFDLFVEKNPIPEKGRKVR
jgi:hypothetical protein